MKPALFALLCIIAAAGCTKERVYQGMYEGLQTRERLVNPSTPGPSQKQPVPYNEYEAERKRALEKERQ